MDERIKREKSRLRKILRDEAQSLPDDYVEHSNRGIRERLLSLGAWRRARTVFIYVGIGREPETGSAIRAALDAGKTVAVPRIHGEGEMEARVITSADVLKPGRFSIPEPDASSLLLLPQDIDLVVAPCVAADRQGYRLGHGGGYYDRFLAHIKGTSICLCREKLIQEALPHDAFDRRVNIVLSERGCIYTRE